MTVKQQRTATATHLELGFLVGLLVGEGHFGGPASWADDHHDTDSAAPAAGPGAFADLFAQLREAWPSQAG